MDTDETELADTLSPMQQELETELTTLGELVGRFRELDAPEAEDLARNTLRAYDAIADVLRMVRTIRGVEGVDTPPPRALGRHESGPVVEASARDFFAEGGPGVVD